MSDLISREKLQMQLNCVDRLQMTIDGRAIEVIPRWNVNKIIEKLPSAEPEIIRCKECKWWEREAEDSPMGYCHACKHGHYSRHWEIHIIRTYEKDFFCADAELKEEKEEE